MSTTTPATSDRSDAGARIESRSIDWVPLSERTGKPWSLFPLWFMSNANITTLATGMVGASLGASFVTSLLAIVLGVAVGTIFTAFHSAQGPQLGLPQMIQSRAQFGYPRRRSSSARSSCSASWASTCSTRCWPPTSSL